MDGDSTGGECYHASIDCVGDVYKIQSLSLRPKEIFSLPLHRSIRDRMAVTLKIMWDDNQDDRWLCLNNATPSLTF